MSEERAAKLKLKRRKVSTAHDSQGPGGTMHPGVPLSVRRSSSGSWLDEINLTASEKMWKQILQAAHPDLKSLSWEALPSLPNFENKDNGKVEKENVEVFKAGERTFEWVPFPTDPISRIVDQNATVQESTTELTVCQDQNTERSNVSVSIGPGTPVPELEKTVVEVQKTSASDVSKRKNKNVPKNPSSQNIGQSESSKKKPLCKLFSTKTKIDDKIKHFSGEAHTSDVVMQDVEVDDITTCASTSQEVDGRTNAATEVMGALENCPMCLKQFPKGSSQLDIDSHLAQCLSESTVDVIW
ncbi:Fanconi anemia core complex-associated protein 20 [Rhinophrynus dorsalis]